MNGKQARELRSRSRLVGAARNWNTEQMSTYYKILKKLFMKGLIK
jgi:hypothetical protein